MRGLFLIFIFAIIVGCGSKTNIEKVNYSNSFSPVQLKRVAILDFSKGGNFQYDSSSLSDRFATEIVDSALFTIVDRKDIDKVIKEAGFQNSGYELGILDEKTLQQLSQLGADTILTGRLLSFKQERKNNQIMYSEAHLTAKMIRIETGEVIWSAEILKSSKPDRIRKEAAHPEELLSGIIKTMCVPLKTENKFRRIIKM